MLQEFSDTDNIADDISFCQTLDIDISIITYERYDREKEEGGAREH